MNPSKSVSFHFAPTVTQTGGAKVASSAANAIASIISTWTAAPAYTSIQSAVFAAAPAPAQQSMAIVGWNWDAIVGQDWYIKNVPQGTKDAVNSEEKSL